MSGGVEKEMFLSVRGRRVYTDRAQYLIATHSVNTTTYPDYEDVHTPELLAYMIYEKSIHLRCTEGLVIETQIFYDVTSQALTFPYDFVFDFAPGLFAMLGSLNSVGDSTILRSFNRSSISSNFITQEDQCFDNEQQHTTKEFAFAFVVGQSTTVLDPSIPEINCFAVFKNNQPTSVPSAEPSGRPSGAPSGEPTSNPTRFPTETPTAIPTPTPTVSPTGSPTRTPTASPTRFPTNTPTVSPTLSPTEEAGNCTFNFLLLDLFGDGFYTTYVNFTTTRPRESNVTTVFHQPNCTSKVVSIFFRNMFD
jgi:hypothetical protein